MVLTREIPGNPQSGRERTLSNIRKCLAARFDVDEFVVTSLAHQPRPGRAMGTLVRLGAGVMSGRRLALQVALFHDAQGIRRLCDHIAATSPDAVLFDSIRTGHWLLAVRQRFPDLRLVADFDDLMSLRFERLLARRLPISLGYLESVVPAWLRRSLQNGWIARSVLLYEAGALRRLEQQVAVAADATTVVSTTDAERLRSGLTADAAGRTRVLPPAVGFPVHGLVTRACNAFVFVGSDSLLQNRLSIEFLVDLWRTTRPSRPLQVVGRMTRAWPDVPGVRFEGFVADLAGIYRDDVVALSPSFVEGGIKTKVLEALGYGTLAVGNALTFEGMGCDPGALAMSTDELAAFVGDPDPRMPGLLEAGTTLRHCIESRTSPSAIEGAWAAVVSPQT